MNWERVFWVAVLSFCLGFILDRLLQWNDSRRRRIQTELEEDLRYAHGDRRGELLGALEGQRIVHRITTVLLVVIVAAVYGVGVYWSR